MNAPALTVLSLGAGVQSTTLALLAVEGVLPKPDAAIFADTGWEPRAVYDHLGRLEAAMSVADIPLHRVQRGNLRDDNLTRGRITIPAFVATADGGSSPASIRQCTRDYKLRPITRKIRDLLDCPVPKRVPKGVTVEQWIGFSTDEVQRATNKADAAFLRSVYPLLDLGMSRTDCQRYLRARGWGEVPKSACVGCPFHGNSMWRKLRDEQPDEWADAVAFDEQMRLDSTKRGALREMPYLHRSLLPLSVAPIDKVTRREWGDAQGDIFDVLAEDGDPDGCSPYGCRSGEQAA